MIVELVGLVYLVGIVTRAEPALMPEAINEDSRIKSGDNEQSMPDLIRHKRRKPAVSLLREQSEAKKQEVRSEMQNVRVRDAGSCILLKDSIL